MPIRWAAARVDSVLEQCTVIPRGVLATVPERHPRDRPPVSLPPALGRSRWGVWRSMMSALGVRPAAVHRRRYLRSTDIRVIFRTFATGFGRAVRMRERPVVGPVWYFVMRPVAAASCERGLRPVSRRRCRRRRRRRRVGRSSRVAGRRWWWCVGRRGGLRSGRHAAERRRRGRP